MPSQCRFVALIKCMIHKYSHSHTHAHCTHTRRNCTAYSAEPQYACERCDDRHSGGCATGATAAAGDAQRRSTVYWMTQTPWVKGGIRSAATAIMINHKRFSMCVSLHLNVWNACWMLAWPLWSKYNPMSRGCSCIRGVRVIRIRKTARPTCDENPTNPYIIELSPHSNGPTIDSMIFVVTVEFSIIIFNDGVPGWNYSHFVSSFTP